MSLVEGTSALKNTVEVADTINTIASTTSQSAEIYPISQYLSESQSDQAQAAMVTYNYVESLQSYIPQVVTGFTATAGGAYSAVSGGVAYVLSTPAAFAAIAAALGIGVGVGLYEVNPEFWNKVSSRLVEAGAIVGDGVLSIFKDGKNYIPESTINVVREVLLEEGAYQVDSYVDSTEYENPVLYKPVSFKTIISGSTPINVYGNTRYLTPPFTTNTAGGVTRDVTIATTSPSTPVRLTCLYNQSNGKYFYVAESQYLSSIVNLVNGDVYSTTANRARTSYNGLSTYYLSTGADYETHDAPLSSQEYFGGVGASSQAILGWFLAFGNIVTGGGVEGLTPESGAVQPKEDTDIPTEYPDWWLDGLDFFRPITREIGSNPTLNPDDYEDFKALPVEIPNIAGNPLEVPYNTPQEFAQDGELANPSGDPDDEPAPDWTRVIHGLDRIIDPNPDPDPDPYPSPAPEPVPGTDTPRPTDPPVDPPTEDSGTTPPIVLPPIGGLGTGLNNVYNPTKAELQEFNAFLWSNDFVDTIKKILNDPMEAVIALQMVYCTPTTTSGGTIVVGSIDTEISSKIVTQQYVTINCGSVSIPEYFKDYTDYSPYTEVLAYLPFIGFVNLEADDIIGSTVTIKYSVDLFTGACLCEITVTKNGLDAILYTFNGNCSVQLPLTSATHSSIVGVLSGLSTAVAGYATGNPIMLASGVVQAGMSAEKKAISRSGSLGSNVGAMGVKKPYLLVRRPIAYNPQNYNKYYGIPSSTTVLFSTLKGYTRVKNIHVENIISATDYEKQIIEDILKKGVIIG